MGYSLNYDYLAKIRGMVTLSTRRKTSNILEGGFRSVYRGRSLEFDDLKEYDFGDNVHDIDWKSSSRTGKVLIRRYVAEKKHNVLFVGDRGAKMAADTAEGEPKEDLTVLVFGTIAYLVSRQGADFSLLYGTDKGPCYHYFRSGEEHLERQMKAYREAIGTDCTWHLEKVLDQCVDRLSRKMMIFVLTDLEGLSRMDERLLRKITVNNDLMVINIEDAYYTGGRAYDVGLMRYASPFLLRSKRLHEAEIRERNRILSEARSRFRKYRIGLVSVASEKDIMEKVIELFETGRG